MHPALDFLCVFWDLNSGSHAFKANTLLPKPTHQPTPKWLLNLSIYQSHQGRPCTLGLLGLNQWFLSGSSKVVGSWFCLYDKLHGCAEATIPQICSTFLIPVHLFPTRPFLLLSFSALTNSFQLIAEYFPPKED